MDVVSLLPSATEIVYALGVEPCGVSHECDHPPAAKSKPAVNRSLIDASATSTEINQQVLQAERNGGVSDKRSVSDGSLELRTDGVYEIDLSLLDTLNPDLIVTQGVCDVCAVDRVLVADAIEQLGLDCEILTTDPHCPGDVLDDIRHIGAKTGTERRAEKLIEELRTRIDAVRARAAPLDAPSVVVLDWMDPVMTAGHWVPEMIEIAGGRAEFDAEASVPREPEEILAVDPEVLVVAPCGFDLDQTKANIDDLTDREGWNELTAVKSDRTYILDGHRFMNRPGPRIVNSLEYLAGLIHPETFESPPDTAARSINRLLWRA